MTIIIQYEYFDLMVNNEFFSITLSFNNTNVNLVIPYDAIISIADPSENFGLKFKKGEKKYDFDKKLDKKNKKNHDNIIDFMNYKKINPNNND